MTEQLPWISVVVGIVMLAKGASWLVDGASRLALKIGMSPFVVGITVVGFGTSMPEFAVSVLAAAKGSGGLSLGNAVGSNIMNLLLVLGVAALVAPIHVLGSRRALWRDLFFGLVPATMLIASAWDGDIERGWAISLLVVFALFMALCLTNARESDESRTVVTGSTLRQLGLTALGIGVLVTGSHLMVDGGVELAHRFGVSDAIIGLTLVAFGTSLPELATSVIAAIKGQSEISVGNVLGSNVFNLGLIIGTAFTIRPATVPNFVIRQDIPFLIVATLLVGLVVMRDRKISRPEGAGMLALVTAYIAYVVIRGG